MRARFLICLCICAGLLHLSAELSAEDVRADDVRVMSFNIRFGTAADGENHWNKRQQFVVDTILAYAPHTAGSTIVFAAVPSVSQRHHPAESGVQVLSDAFDCASFPGRVTTFKADAYL
ncbi:MAG: hypothetical protein RIK87_23135 [Fuerstiella sp.]